MMFWLSVTAMVVATSGCVYLVAATILVGRSVRRPVQSQAKVAPGVTILKPLYGNEPGLFENLSSFCTQHYPGHVQIVFGVQNPSDPAIAVVQRLRDAQDARDLDLVVEAQAHGSNRKVSSLVNMQPRIQQEIVVIADSDIRVDSDYLAEVVAALNQPGVNAVTCLYHGVPLAGIWSNFSALFINAHFLPNVIVGMAVGLARPCFGSTLALRHQTLAEIGGFMPFVDKLADDYAMGAALRASGGTVAMPPFSVAHMCADSSLRDFWRHQLRWARTIKNIDPLGYAGSAVAHPLPWALIAMVLGAFSTTFWPAVAVAATAVVARVMLLRKVKRTYALPSQSYWLAPACDLLSFVLFVESFFGRRVSWKDYQYFTAGNWITHRESRA